MNSNLLDDNSLAIREDLEVAYPTKGARLGAFFIDGIIMYPVNFILALLLGGHFILVLTALSFPIYKIMLEGSQGQTIGKKLMNIKVVKDDGDATSLTFMDANNRFLLWWPMYISILVTNLLRLTAVGTDWTISLMTIVTVFAALLYCASILSVFAGTRGKTWHDKVGETICVKADSLRN